MSYDSIIHEVGTMGWWQGVILLGLFIPDIFMAFTFFLPVFAWATPAFKCAASNDSNATFYSHANNSLVLEASDVCERCSEFEFDSEDGLTTIVTEWNLVCDLDYVKDLIITIQMCGVLTGAGLCGQLSDTFGRRKPCVWVFALVVVAGLLSAIAPNWQTFAAARFFVGIAGGGFFCVVAAYPMEFIGPKWRTFCGTAGFWAFGEMGLAGIAYLEPRWRYLTAITSLMGLLSFAIFWLVPESPRWLAQKGRTDEAQAIFATIARRNKRPVPNMNSLDKDFLSDEVDNKTSQKIYTYLDLFKSKQLAKRTAIILFTWFTIFMTYFEMTYYMSYLSGNRYLNLLLGGLFDLAAMFLVIALNNKMGRRNFTAALLVVAVVCNCGMLILKWTNKDDDLAILFKLMALIGKAAGVAGTYACQIFTAEIYPTCIRNIGIGAGSMAARFGQILAPQILYLGSKFELAPYLIIVPLCALTLPMTYMLPETNMKPLEDKLPSAKTTVIKVDLNSTEDVNGVCSETKRLNTSL